MPTISETKAIVKMLNPAAVKNPRLPMWNIKQMEFAYDLEKVDKIRENYDPQTGQVNGEYTDIWINGCCDPITIVLDYGEMLDLWYTV